MRSTSFWLCILALFAGVYSQCAQDYECGNVPYSICTGGVDDCPSTIPGLGVDPATNQVYFAQVCRAEADAGVLQRNITFKSVPAAGGVPTVVQSRKQIPAAANPGYVFDVVDGQLFFSIESRSPGQLLTALDLNTKEQSKTISTNNFFQNIIEFDIVNKETYVCNIVFKSGGGYYYEVRGFDGLLKPNSGAISNYSMYTVEIPSICTAIRARRPDLFFSVVTPNEDYTVYSSTFFRGSTSCYECGTAATKLFTVENARITDFDVSGDRIYYGTASGIFSSDLSGGNAKHISWSSGSTGVRVLGDRVYWNSGVSILSDSLNGNDVKQINTFAGTCGCRKGFTGANCAQCDGQIQWHEGIPSCISLAENGNPVTCSFDYQCTGAPYTYCSSTCRCRTGFTGAGCNQCEDSTKKITWNNGLPSCQ